jgi:hypothetical protein
MPSSAATGLQPLLQAALFTIRAVIFIIKAVRIQKQGGKKNWDPEAEFYVAQDTTRERQQSLHIVRGPLNVLAR